MLRVWTWTVRPARRDIAADMGPAHPGMARIAVDRNTRPVTRLGSSSAGTVLGQSDSIPDGPLGEAVRKHGRAGATLRMVVACHSCCFCQTSRGRERGRGGFGRCRIGFRRNLNPAATRLDREYLDRSTR